MYKFKMYSPCCTWYLELYTDSSDVADLTNNLFGDFVVLQQPHKPNLIFLSVSIITQDEGYVMTGNGKTYQIKDLNGVGFYLYAVIDKLVEGNMAADFFVFHGGVVAQGDQAYGIIAPTMAGKSTLITYLSLNGFEYLADDYIFVRRDNREIVPMPLPSSLRDTTVLDGISVEFYTIEGYNELKGEYNVLFSPSNVPQNKYHLKKLFFIRRTEENKMRLMDHGELYKELLFNMKNALELDRELVAVGQLVEYIGGYELFYNNLKYALSCFEKR